MEFNDAILEELIAKITDALKEDNKEEAARYMDIVMEEYPEVANILMQSVEFQNIMAENEENETKPLPIEENPNRDENFNIDTDKIIEDMNSTLEIEPKTIEEYIQKGTVLTITEKFTEAIECFDEALKIDKNNISALIAKANAYELMGKDLEAMEIYDIVMETDVDDVYDYMSKGFILENNERFKEALDCYNAALKKEKDNSNILFLKSNVLISLDRFVEAIETLDRAIETYDNSYFETIYELANAYHNKGVALFKLDRKSEALEAFSLALGLNPEYAPSYYEIAQILEEDGKYEKALENYNRCLGFDSANYDIIESIQRVEKLLNNDK